MAALQLALAVPSMLLVLGGGGVAPEPEELNAISQIIVTMDGTALSITTPAIPIDASVPQSGEGVEYTQLATVITPTSATSTLLIEVNTQVYTVGSVKSAITALFKDSDANALSADYTTRNGTDWSKHHTLVYKMISGTTDPITFKVRVGSATGEQIYVNRSNGVSDLFSTALRSTLKIIEVV